MCASIYMKEGMNREAGMKECDLIGDAHQPKKYRTLLVVGMRVPWGYQCARWLRGSALIGFHNFTPLASVEESTNGFAPAAGGEVLGGKLIVV